MDQVPKITVSRCWKNRIKVKEDALQVKAGRLFNFKYIR